MAVLVRLAERDVRLSVDPVKELIPINPKLAFYIYANLNIFHVRLRRVSVFLVETKIIVACRVQPELYDDIVQRWDFVLMLGYAMLYYARWTIHDNEGAFSTIYRSCASHLIDLFVTIFGFGTLPKTNLPFTC